MPYWFYWINIGWRWWVWKNQYPMIHKPSFCQFACMARCAILLEHDFRSLLLHLVIESVKMSLEDLWNVPLPSHSSTSSSWIFQYSKRFFPPFHDASPDHYLHGWLLECWYNTVFIVFFISMACDINMATVVIEVNIASIWPYQVLPLVNVKTLEFLCHATLFLFWSAVKNGTFHATHRWYPASAAVLRTMHSLISMLVSCAICWKGFRQSLTQFRTTSSFAWPVSFVGCPECRRFLVVPVFLYLVQISDVVDGLIPYLEVDWQSFPMASTALMNLFFVGVSCWTQVVLLTVIVRVKDMDWVGN